MRKILCMQLGFQIIYFPQGFFFQKVQIIRLTFHHTDLKTSVLSGLDPEVHLLDVGDAERISFTARVAHVALHMKRGGGHFHPLAGLEFPASVTSSN